MKEPFIWDNYSDQPAQLKDTDFKKRMRKKELFSFFKTLIISLITLPISLVLMPFSARKQIDTEKFFSLGIDFMRNPKETNTLIKELEVKNLLLRFKLWEMHTLQTLKIFLTEHTEKHITLKILQDRENIQNKELFIQNLRKIFQEVGEKVEIFEIGTTINRAKWGFFSVNEYNNFYQTAYNLKNTEFPQLSLIGSGVIDFEYHFTAHTLFNFFQYKYDGVAALLYVDRRGAPENMQLGFALNDKIAWLSTMVWLSPKTANRLYITEVNWPLSNTAPYAPTSETECVSEEVYSNYMLRYYLLAFASQQVNSLSWHQLIAPGYGLVDNREEIKKYKAFFVYKFMISSLKNAQFLRLDIKRNYYILQCLVNDNLLQIHWSLKETTLKNEDFFDVYSSSGEKIDKKELVIGARPTYIYINKAVGEKINCL